MIGPSRIPRVAGSVDENGLGNLYYPLVVAALKLKGWYSRPLPHHSGPSTVFWLFNKPGGAGRGLPARTHDASRCPVFWGPTRAWMAPPCPRGRAGWWYPHHACGCAGQGAGGRREITSIQRGSIEAYNTPRMLTEWSLKCGRAEVRIVLCLLFVVNEEGEKGAGSITVGELPDHPRDNEAPKWSRRFGW